MCIRDSSSTAEPMKTFPQSNQEIENEISQLLQQINNLNKIHLEQSIGSGVNGIVYKYELGNKKLAVKCYTDKLKAEEENEMLEKIQQIKDCPSIIPYYGMKKLIIQINDQLPFEGYTLFFEACQTDLKKFIESGQSLQPTQVFDFITQISLALTYLQVNDCFHRDLKPANILLSIKDDKIQFFLCDFGESAIIQQEMQTTYNTQSVRGTPFYWPPELYKI
eukprot:TRINITY_DN12441_c0_g1_i1.p3 TRINITY_DN12441_c0_g1~~TRINITY_DN12441_c0_g1_i1.p3  ORF type:complete len:221 (-),score=23.32 TRINITY_DN12441_c0_g1_i1:740-1402(-)